MSLTKSGMTQKKKKKSKSAYYKMTSTDTKSIKCLQLIILQDQASVTFLNLSESMHAAGLSVLCKATFKSKSSKLKPFT